MTKKEIIMLKLERKSNKKEIKTLYRNAFPKEERVPFLFLRYKEKRGKGHFYAAIDNDQFVGLVYTVIKGKYVYIFYLAVSSEYRGCGYGSKILDAIKEKYPTSIFVLLIEDTDQKDAFNYKERIRRLSFYNKNGFRQLHCKVEEQGVLYEILSTSSMSKEDYYSIVNPFFSPLVYKLMSC
jgi:GNAT superfamily N-acetyltransferase